MTKEKSKDQQSKNKSKKNSENLSACQNKFCQDLILKLEEKNENLEKQVNRALADYQNLLKQAEKEKTDFVRYSLENFLLEILPIFDNLKMAINTLSEEEKTSPWVEGVKYVIKQFRDTFSSNGIEEIKTIGEKFDYNTMEAVEGDGDLVEKEVRPGYLLNKKVIISAKVALSKTEAEKEVLNNKEN